MEVKDIVIRAKEEFKQTEVGVISKNWLVVELPTVIWFQEGPGLRNWQFTKRGLKVINVTNLQENGKLDINNTDRHISWSEFEKMYKHFLVDENDVVIASSGNSYCKVSVVSKADLPLLMNTSVIRFKPLKDIDYGYMLSFLKSKSFKEQIDLLITGGAQPNFGPAHLRKILIPLPPTKAEQTAIATVLSDTDALISRLETLIEKKRAIKQGAMQQLLTGKTRLAGFSETWKEKKFGDVVKGFSSGSTPSRNRPDFYKGGIKWITSGELNYNVITDTVEKITQEACINANLKFHPKGTFLIAITGLEAEGTRGSCGITGVEATTNQSCMALYPTEELLTEYLFHYYVHYGDALALQYCQGTKQQSYTARLVKVLPILLPSSIKEQRAIAQILSDMDAELAGLEQKLAKYKLVKQGMMQELLTGKTRLV